MKPLLTWRALGLALLCLACAPLGAGAADPEHEHQHAHSDEGSHADAHDVERAPIGVMGDHTHPAGEWMLSYRYMYMDMDGNRDGSSRKGTGDVLRDYMVAPSEMTMVMHMLGLMYAPTDDLTLMAMVPHVRNSMRHKTRMGTRFSTHSSALGDSTLTALWRVHHDDQNHVHLNLGLGLPTGDITQKDHTPLGRVRLPYPMQIGSGSWELQPGVTWLRQWEDWSFGAQSIATFTLNENRKDYQWGPRFDVNVWGSRLLTDALGGSLRLKYAHWTNIHGSDDALNPNLVPTADPDRRAGRRLDVGLGLDYTFQRRELAGHRLAAEVLLPVYQWLDGPQLETDWSFIVGWEKVF